MMQSTAGATRGGFLDGRNELGRTASALPLVPELHLQESRDEGDLGDLEEIPMDDLSVDLLKVDQEAGGAAVGFAQVFVNTPDDSGVEHAPLAFSETRSR